MADTELKIRSDQIEVITSKVYGCHRDFVNRYRMFVSYDTMDMFRLS